MAGTKFTVEQVSLTSGTKMCVEGVSLDKGYTTPAAVETFINPIKKTGNETISGVKTFASVPKSTVVSPLSDTTDLMSLASLLAFFVRSKFLIFRDDFATDMQWNKHVTGSGSANVAGYAISSTGAGVLSTGATINSIACYSAFENANLIPVAHKPWDYEARVKVSSLTSCRARVGFANNSNSSNPNIFTAGIFMGFDFTPTASANWRFANGDGGTYGYTDTGVPVVADQWVTFRMRSAGVDNAVYWSVNGGAETLLASGAYDYYSGLAQAITNTAASDKQLIVDLVAFAAITTR